MAQQLVVNASIQSTLDEVWRCWNNPDDILIWNSASDDWHTTTARNDLRAGGSFSYRMEARDQSFGFDFAGTYTSVTPQQQIAYTMGDDRKVEVRFVPNGTGVDVTVAFDAESENSLELQQSGWQAILNHFRDYVNAQTQAQ